MHDLSDGEYANVAGARFDPDHYLTNHMPLVEANLSGSV